MHSSFVLFVLFAFGLFCVKNWGLPLGLRVYCWIFLMTHYLVSIFIVLLWGAVETITPSMTTLGPSRRVSKRRSQVKIRSKIDVVDLNSPPIVSHELELSSGSALLQLSQGTSVSMNSHHIHPTGQQHRSAAPSNDVPNSFVIDVEEIEDEVQLLSSSRGFCQVG